MHRLIYCLLFAVLNVEIIIDVTCFDADPTKRMSITEVMKHPWYLKNLSPGVIGYNDALVKEEMKKSVQGVDQGLERILKVLADIHPQPVKSS